MASPQPQQGFNPGQITIFGAGAVGCYLGGRLQAAGASVTFIGRPRIAEELSAHGLTLSDYSGASWSLPATALKLATSPDAAATASLVLVTVKSLDTAAAASELTPYLKPGALVISFQNGLGNADMLREALPNATVLAGMVPFNIIARGPGSFHQGTAGDLSVQASPALRPFLNSFEQAGLALTEHEEFLTVQWAKLLLNLNNAINALSGVTLRRELEQRPFRLCLALAQSEALSLLEDANIIPAQLTSAPPNWMPRLLSLPNLIYHRLAGRALTIDPLARSSMADDLAAGRLTEVDYINGEVVRLGHRLGRPAPINTRICHLVHQSEQSGKKWDGRALLKELRTGPAKPA